jgi:hypothetical protein
MGVKSSLATLTPPGVYQVHDSKDSITDLHISYSHFVTDLHELS